MTDTAFPASLAFIGGGNMARSLIGGLLKNGMPGDRIHVADPNESTRAALATDFGVHTHATAADAALQAECWLLAVKPQVMDSVCDSLRDAVAQRQPLVISIAAGIPLQRLRQHLGEGAAIVRTMPNTPALIGLGATGMFAADDVSASQRAQAQAVMQSAGLVEWIADESLMDAVTAVSGSGPAYVFLLAEAMADAAQSLGLPRGTAIALANQTLLGAAHLLSESTDADAATLRQRVTSPNGTTQAAIESFERDAFRDIVQRALTAARDRGIELAAG